MSNYNDDGRIVEETYTAPVAETVVPERSFWSRFWWILPLLALLIALPFILRGCNRTEVAEPAPVVPAPETPAVVEPAEPAETTEPATTMDQCEGVTGTVDFRWWGDDTRAELTNQALDLFEAKYPGITVNRTSVAFSGFWDQLQVEAAAQNTPDVFQANVEWLSTLGPGGIVAPLNEFEQIDLAPIQDSLSETTFGGNVYGVPTGLNAASLLVNLDILEEAGIPVPNDQTWTWEEFADIAKQVSDAGLTNANGESVFGISHLGGNQVARVWANQTDGGLFDANGNVNWSEESIQAYLDYYQNLIESGAAPSADIITEFGTLSPDQSLMGVGRAAFQPQWSNQVGAVASASGANIGILRFPGDTTSPHIGTWLRPSLTYAIARSAQSPDAAACMVNFLINDPEAADLQSVNRGIPMNPVIFEQVVPTLDGNNALQAEFIEHISANPGESIPMPVLNDDINNVLLLSTENAIFGRQSTADAAAGLRTALQNAIG